MRYLWQHIFRILDSYTRDMPLHHFLKQYYKQYPILGSRDRRGISDAVYAWYRCGRAFAADTHTREEKIIAALVVCGLQPKALLGHFPDHWKDQGQDSLLAVRLCLLEEDGYYMVLSDIFPFKPAYSEGITREFWILSLLQQPDLFLRIRKHKKQVVQLLEDKQIPFTWLTDTCLSLPNGAAIDQLLPPDSYVIQDASSQSTGTFFRPVAGESWWDCCSGAGGKSLLLKDLQPGVKLLASDIRESILHNLRQRFRLYQLEQPEILVIDAADHAAVQAAMGNRQFDAVLCDVPCTGSGTWARTPEDAYFFDPETLPDYSRRGAAILRNVLQQVRPGGKVVYMTCSVFREENEAVVEQVAAEMQLAIRECRLINGLEHKADSLFVAVLELPVKAG